ncbi:hypothetical protein [Shinella sp.]|nr:hypothetical protein [Shinella sp.]MDX3976352.1 hypothetical protein [Shinella sp.]
MFSVEVEVFAVPIAIDDVSATTWSVGSAKLRLAAGTLATAKNLADVGNA